jgi:hypothetical protein
MRVHIGEARYDIAARYIDDLRRVISLAEIRAHRDDLVAIDGDIRNPDRGWWVDNCSTGNKQIDLVSRGHAPTGAGNGGDSYADNEAERHRVALCRTSSKRLWWKWTPFANHTV